MYVPQPFCNMSLIRKYGLAIAGLVVGSIGGYLYYQYVGCAGNTCPITSRPLNSTIYGAVMGVLLFTAFQNNKKTE